MIRSILQLWHFDSFCLDKTCPNSLANTFNWTNSWILVTIFFWYFSEKMYIKIVWELFFLKYSLHTIAHVWKAANAVQIFIHFLLKHIIFLQCNVFYTHRLKNMKLRHKKSLENAYILYNLKLIICFSSIFLSI